MRQQKKQKKRRKKLKKTHREHKSEIAFCRINILVVFFLLKAVAAVCPAAVSTSLTVLPLLPSSTPPPSFFTPPL